jgi:hypothetical protein
MVATWTDNGCQFRNVVEVALERALGVKPHHIPPGRPEANGLVERYNGIVATSCGGVRSMLPSTTVSLNSVPTTTIPGASPETLWRALRPLTSRWTHLGVKQAIHGVSKGMTEEEFLTYLSSHDDLVKKLDPKTLCETIESKMRPIREALASETLRKQMAKKLKWKRNQSPGIMALLSGDRVICKNNQYVAKVGAGRFQTDKEGHVKEYIVVSTSGGFVQLEQVGAGTRSLRHEADLKIMPKVLSAASHQVDEEVEEFIEGEADKVDEEMEEFREEEDDKVDEEVEEFIEGQVLKGRDWKVKVMKDDGRCFFRTAVADKGNLTTAQVDKESLSLRSEVNAFAKAWIDDLPPHQKRQKRMQVANEMKDDPQWDTSRPFSWDRYFEYQKNPRVYATHFNIETCAMKTGTPVEIYKTDASGDFQRIFTELGGNVDAQPLRVLLVGAIHYNLLVKKNNLLVKKKPPLLKRPAQATKFGRCPLCNASMQVVPPSGKPGDRPWIGCSKYNKGCSGYLRSVHPSEEELMPERFFKKMRVTF